MYCTISMRNAASGGRTATTQSRSVRARISVFLSLAALLSCSKSSTISDNSTLIVAPGRGITNVCEIGMTLPQIRKAAGKTTTHGIYDGSWSWQRVRNWGQNRFVLVHCLGAIAPLEGNQSISNLDFYVQPYRAPMIPGLEVRTPFQGRLGNKLSFQGGVVSKADVETTFGKPKANVTLPSEVLEMRRRGESVSLANGSGHGELWYPAQGVAFFLKNNVVVSFEIFPLKKAND